MKKTLHEEIKNSNSGSFGSIDNNSPAILTPTSDNYNDNNSANHTSHRKNVVIDEVNFRYLKHVVLKFLTSREYEAKHLTKAVSTLLCLTKEEEKLLIDTLNWKTSWFGSKPDFSL
jgi:golgin subfamily A protein 1